MSTKTLGEDFRRLKVGDIFLASYPALSGDRGTAICLVIGESADQIEARTVTTQWTLRFDRTSLEAASATGTAFAVEHAKPLPPNLQAVLVGLDRRYSIGGETKLTNDEKRALLFVDDLLRAKDR